MTAARTHLRVVLVVVLIVGAFWLLYNHAYPDNLCDTHRPENLCGYGPPPGIYGAD